MLAKCSKPYHQYLIAKGGEGGSARSAYKGEHGESLEIEIHLKLCPNIGLLGFPNAGKSALLKAMVPDKSIKIGEYPFTTTNPQVAFWSNPSHDSEFNKTFTLTVADLPGIIEGASRNRGKGYKFLKHLDNADIIVMVVDCQGFQLKNEIDCPIRNPLQTVAILNREIEQFNPKLAKKPFVCVLNKTDTLREDERETVRSFERLLCSAMWIDSIEEHIRPRFPIVFDYVIALSARKTGKNNDNVSIGSCPDECFSLDIGQASEDQEDEKTLSTNGKHRKLKSCIHERTEDTAPSCQAYEHLSHYQQDVSELLDLIFSPVSTLRPWEKGNISEMTRSLKKLRKGQAQCSPLLSDFSDHN
ncbi:unnamed protein product [Caenorhabditis sp. 36 PRJEB53466]|nr:unnamed protein product [Caenorhabditis sp. 36 PRJEB53466]